MYRLPTFRVSCQSPPSYIYLVFISSIEITRTYVRVWKGIRNYLKGERIMES